MYLSFAAVFLFLMSCLSDAFADNYVLVQSTYYYQNTWQQPVANRFECGLFDPGSLHRYDSNIYFLQPACFISMKVKEDSNYSYSFFIPISSDENMIIPDTKWYEAGMIMQNKPLDELLPKLEPQPNNH